MIVRALAKRAGGRTPENGGPRGPDVPDTSHPEMIEDFFTRRTALSGSGVPSRSVSPRAQLTRITAGMRKAALFLVAAVAHRSHNRESRGRGACGDGARKMPR